STKYSSGTCAWKKPPSICCCAGTEATWRSTSSAAKATSPWTYAFEPHPARGSLQRSCRDRAATVTNERPTNLEQLLDRIGEAARQHQDGGVSLDAILDEIGRRSFGPLLLVAGLITLAPIIGDIPGVPGLMGLLVLLIAGQVLFHHE